MSSRTEKIKAALRERYGEAGDQLIRAGMDFNNHALGCDRCHDVVDTHPEGRTDENAKLLCPTGLEMHEKFEAMLAKLDKVN